MHIHIQLGGELEKRVDAACQRTGQKRSGLVRYALTRYLESLEASEPAKLP
jgi:metal-responsive CopG/Arc/MetJ family transcriptional regulator